MTTKERRELLREEVVKKYERYKYKAAVAYQRGEISADDLRMRKKFLTREANIRLAEIDQMPYGKLRREFEKLMKKNESQ